MANHTTPNQEFFAAIGWHTTSWAFIENGLEFLVIAIHDAGGNQIDTEAPWSLERKIKYLRRCFRQIAALAPYHLVASTLLDQVKIASESRHDIIHGTFQHFIGSGEAKMTRLLRTKTADRIIKPFTLTTAGIYENASRFGQIGNELLTLANQVWDDLKAD